MKNAKIENSIKEAKKNKKQRQCGHSGTGYQILHMNQSYPSIITNAKEEESVIALDFDIFKNQMDLIQKTVRFKMNGGNFFYDEICETLGKEGNPADLIGEYVAVHFEKNEGFTNLRVDYGMDEQEFREMVECLGSKSTKKKTCHKKRTSQKAVAGKMSGGKTRKKKVRLDEPEDMYSDSDYEEDYDGDDLESEDEDASDYEEEYGGDYEDGDDYEPEEE